VFSLAIRTSWSSSTSCSVDTHYRGMVTPDEFA
jgi:hypothetical protein